MNDDFALERDLRAMAKLLEEKAWALENAAEYIRTVRAQGDFEKLRERVQAFVAGTPIVR